MWFEFAFALRHLTSGKARSGLVSIITFISILGVVVGVTALITVLAVIDGAQEDYMKRLVDQYAHIEIRSPYGDRLYDYREVMETVLKDDEVQAASPLLRQYALLKPTIRFNQLSSARPAQIIGVDPDLESEVSALSVKNERLEGKYDPGKDEAVVGKALAQRMGLAIGDTIYVVTGQVANTAMGIVPHQYPIEVVGLFDTGLLEVDDMVVYVSLPTAQSLNLIEDAVDVVHLRLDDPYKADVAKQRIANLLANERRQAYMVYSWGDLNRALFSALKLEKLAMYIITMLVVMVAALNIIGTLILVTIEKTREIGILRAMGTSRRSISRIFIIEGGLIGFAGTALGIVFGLILCYLLEHHFPDHLIPEAVYGLDGLPVLVKWQTVLTISVCSMFICLLASVIPATRAARLDVVEALRYE